MRYSWPVPESCLDPMERLVKFYVANGYDIRNVEFRPVENAPNPQTDESGKESEGAEPSDVMVCATLCRGRPGDGWWASDMTDLAVVADLTLERAIVEATFVVDVRGQFLSRGDREFWQSEAISSSAYLSGVSDIVDCRAAEVLRGKAVSHSIRSGAKWLGVVVFLVLIVLGYIAVRTVPAVAEIFEALRGVLF
jgi:hypothetical protein